jgi:hypothetical protein
VRQLLLAAALGVSVDDLLAREQILHQSSADALGAQVRVRSPAERTAVAAFLTLLTAVPQDHAGQRARHARASLPA